MKEKWISMLRACRDRLDVPSRPRLVPEGARAFVEQQRLTLIDRRVAFASWFGVITYLLDCGETWVTLHDLIVLAAQVTAEAGLLALALVSLSRWGRGHRLALFHGGYALVLLVYEFSICYTHSFGTVWGDGFPEAFGFYCLLIPVSVTATVVVGVAALLLLSIPEAILTGHLWAALLSVVGNVTAFVILVGSRFVANRSWENETLARRTEAAAVQLQADTARLQLEFISAVSHELRNPLTVLCSTSEQLLSGRIAADAKDGRYRMLVRESERLRRRVEGLLDFGRMLRPDTIGYAREYLDPAEVVEGVVREWESTGAAPDYRIVVDINVEAPLILGDGSALSSVVWNLLDNAIKYSPECKTVWVHVGRNGECAAITVRDKGVGIGDADMKRIFEKYVRGESARHTSGTGIGLAIVHYVVVAHRGTIAVTSEVGEGSAFTVLLPAADASTFNGR